MRAWGNWRYWGIDKCARWLYACVSICSDIANTAKSSDELTKSGHPVTRSPVSAWELRAWCADVSGGERWH